MTWSSLSPHFRYEIEGTDGRTSLRFAGELDLASCGVARTALAEAGAASSETVVDLSQVTFIDSLGLNCLLTARREADAAGRSLILRRPHRAVRHLLEITGTLQFLGLEDVDSGIPALPSIGADAIALCNQALETALGLAETDMGNVQLFDESAGGLRIVAQRGFKQDFLDFFEIVDHGDSACGAAMSQTSPVWVSDVTESAVFAGSPALEVMLEARARSVASLPIVNDSGRLLGMISTHERRERRWSRGQKLQLEQFARTFGRGLQAAIAAQGIAPAAA